MKKILVLGAGGMAGHVVATYLDEEGYEVDTLSASNKLNERTSLIDAMNRAALEEALDSNPYDVVVNCIGMLIRQSEERKDLSTYLNSFLPHFLENHFKQTETKVIHLSTDCVFSGKNGPYTESSTHDGELFYDKTKALGEIVNEKDLTFRMSIIGPDMQSSGVGLFNWFQKQTGAIDGYTGSLWNGITTIELARGIKDAIEQDLRGLYHLVPQKNISKYELLKLFVDVFNKDLIINPVEGIVSDKTLVNTRKDFDFEVKSYPEMVNDMKAWIIAHPSLYRHYE